MRLEQHQRLRRWFPISVAGMLYAVFTIAEGGQLSSPTPTVVIACVVSFVVLQFAVTLLPAECPQCGQRLRFQRSLDDSDGSRTVWYEYYCFKWKEVITWEKKHRSNHD
jgi:hypothetical protein